MTDPNHTSEEPSTDGRRLRGDLEVEIARLESQASRQVVVQQQLITARDQRDQELMRFRALADYVARALAIEDPEAFRTLTLESLIEAFEFEVALFLGIDATGPLKVLDHFGFEQEPPATLLWDPAWTGDDVVICRGDHPLLKAWSALGLCGVIACPLHDKNGALSGIIAGGTTTENEEHYGPISEDMCPAFRLLVEQAGSLQVRHLLIQQLQALTRSYSRFVPFEFLELLGRDSIQEVGVGDQIRLEMGVLFSDLRGFTSLAEPLRPEEVFAQLNAYLAAMEPPITAQHGFINQYQGDAIMALFHTGADAALDAAIGMHRALEAFNAVRHEAGLSALESGIGIHHGPLMLGAIGGSRRLEPNVVGDTANLASRTESMTKFYGARILVTESTCAALSQTGKRMLRELDRVVVKGRREPIAIFEVLDVDPPELLGQKIAYQDTFSRGLRLYRDGVFKEARLSFMECMLRAPNDGAANLYVDRCGELARHPPYVWAGVTVLEDK